MTPAKPIDPRQHVWWHRLRRLHWWGFVLGGGAVLWPLITVIPFGGVVYWYGYPFDTWLRFAPVMWGVTAPVYIAASAWTWSHMEKRYHATLSVNCPGCGYVLAPGIGDRCPECGEPTAS